MGNLLTGTLGKVLTEGVGNVLTGTLGKVLTEGVGNVLDIYKKTSISIANIAEKTIPMFWKNIIRIKKINRVTGFGYVPTATVKSVGSRLRNEQSKKQNDNKSLQFQLSFC